MNTINTLHDEVQTEAPASNCVRMSMQPSEALTGLLNSLTCLQEAILHDTPVTRHDMDELNSQLGAVSVDLGDRLLTSAELRAMPELKKSVKIWQTLLAGGFTVLPVLSNLRYITDELVACILLHSDDYSDLNLSGLLGISDSQLRSILSFPGRTLEIDAKALSHEQIIALAGFKGEYLTIKGMKKLTDADQAAALATFHGKHLNLDTQELSDAAAAALGQFRASKLMLWNLATISKDGMRALGRSQNNIHEINVTEPMKTRMCNFWVDLDMRQMRERQSDSQ